MKKYYLCDLISQLNFFKFVFKLLIPDRSVSLRLLDNLKHNVKLLLSYEIYKFHLKLWISLILDIPVDKIIGLFFEAIYLISLKSVISKEAIL